jgi:hypothetical protein
MITIECIDADNERWQVALRHKCREETRDRQGENSEIRPKSEVSIFPLTVLARYASDSDEAEVSINGSPATKAPWLLIL